MDRNFLKEEMVLVIHGQIVVSLISRIRPGRCLLTPGLHEFLPCLHQKVFTTATACGDFGSCFSGDHIILLKYSSHAPVSSPRIEQLVRY